MGVFILLTENGNKPRKKAATPGTLPKSAVGGGRRVSAPPQFNNAGTMSEPQFQGFCSCSCNLWETVIIKFISIRFCLSKQHNHVGETLPRNVMISAYDNSQK